MNTLKTNSRSFRYSDRVAEILDGFKGNSLNDKFNNLVLFCFEQVPARENALKDIEKRMAQKEKEYYKMCQKLQNVSDLIQTLKTLEYYGQLAEKRAEQLKQGFFPDKE